MRFLFVLIIIVCHIFLVVFPAPLFAVVGNVTITASVPGCGDGIIQSGEQCEGANLAGNTCQILGYTGGTLSCRTSCQFNTSGCLGGGGGGGGGGAEIIPVVTQVTFSGRAYPMSKVGVLKDGQQVITTIAGPDAKFSVALTGLASGSYTFSVFGEDKNGERSALFNFSVFITTGASTTISGIFISPTIGVDKLEVKRGDNIAIFGQSAPGAEITIAVNSIEEIFAKTKSDIKDGTYLYNFDTTPLNLGQHSTKSKSALEGEISSFGKAVGFAVGEKNIPSQPTKCPAKADLNGDCRVNLIDFSIAAYWYKRPISVEFSRKEKSFLSGDGKVDLVDFSIMGFYWTG